MAKDYLENEIKEDEELQIGIDVPKTAQSPYQTERIISQSLDIQPNGDVMIGDYTNTYGCLWDASAKTFDIKGTITAYGGVIGGWTIGATNLIATSGGNTTLLSSGATALSAGPTGLPTVTITQAGVLTATGASITGSITATTGTIGGWVIGATSITDAAGLVGMSSAVTGGDDIRFWAGHATPASAPFKVTEAGALTASSATITGAITINSGSGIANLSDAGALAVLSVIGNAYITDLAVSKLTAGSISSKDIVLAITAGTGDVAIRAGKTDFTNTESGFILGLDDSDSDLAKFYIGDAITYFNWTGAGVAIAGSLTTTAGSAITTSYLSGLVAQANLNIANMGWTQTCVFSATDLDTVAWAIGVLTTADGTSYNIGAGNTGNMAARTYIYLDIAVSTTAYQVTTTATTAVGVGKVLVATAINGAVEPTWEVFGGIGGLNIPGTSIVAASITTSEIAANTIVAGNMNVAQLSAISADLGAITAGTIVMPNTGYIRGGQTAYNTGTGFFLGYDTAAYKLSIGDATTQWITWDGASLEATNISLVDTYTTSLAVTTGMGVMLLNDGKIAPTLADTVSNGSPTSQFIGIATETKAAGLACKVRTTGKTTAVSGLTTGSIYYLSNTALVTSNTISQATQNASVDLTVERTQTFKPTKTLVTRIIIYTSGARDFTVAVKSGVTTLGSKVETGPAGAGELSFTFTNPIFVTPGTSYTISITAGGFPDAFVYYNTSDVYADGAFSSGGDAYFKIYENMGDGVIGTSAGSVSKKAGLALSATSLQILNS